MQPSNNLLQIFAYPICLAFSILGPASRNSEWSWVPVFNMERLPPQPSHWVTRHPLARPVSVLLVSDYPLTGFWLGLLNCTTKNSVFSLAISCIISLSFLSMDWLVSDILSPNSIVEMPKYNGLITCFGSVCQSHAFWCSLVYSLLTGNTYSNQSTIPLYYNLLSFLTNYLLTL